MRANAGEVDGGLLTDDLELLLREINDFCSSNAGRGSGCIPKSLDDYLLYVAKTGNTVFPWNHVRNLFRLKLELAISQFPGEPSVLESTVFERFDLFRSAPFTIQRLSELITEPNRHYKMKEKYMFALEKTVFVVSTVEPLSADYVNNGDSTEDLELESSNEFTEENANTLNASFIQHENSSEESQLVHFDGTENVVKEMDAQGQETVAASNFIVAELSVEVPAESVEELTALEPSTEVNSTVGCTPIIYAEVESDVKEMDTQAPIEVVMVQEPEYIVTELVEAAPVEPTDDLTELETNAAKSSIGESKPTSFDEMESEVKESEVQNQLPLGVELVPVPSFSAPELSEDVPVERVDDSTVMETEAETETEENGPDGTELITLEEVKDEVEEESVQPSTDVVPETPEESSLVAAKLSEEVPVGQVENSAIPAAEG